jgi:hypothetical protein
VDVNAPGAMVMLVAPLVIQINVLLEPQIMLSAWAANELIVGVELFPEEKIDDVNELQPASKAQKNRIRT